VKLQINQSRRDASAWVAIVIASFLVVECCVRMAVALWGRQ